MENTRLQLADICDLEKLYKMIEDWSNATGMSAILTDSDGEETMKAWGKSLFCRTLLYTTRGYEACCGCMDALESGIQICYAGACHFVIPLHLPDGTFVGKVVAGQTLLTERLCTEQSVSKDFRDTIMGWCRIIAIPVNQKAGERPQKIMIGIQRIDEEKRKELNAQRLLAKAYEDAKRANAAKTEFLSRMSHDIRTPMNGILGMSRIAEKSIQDPERVLDALHKIDQAGKQLEMLINDVLDMSRLESGRTELTREPFNIIQILDNNYVPIHLMAEEKQIRMLGPHANIEHRNLIGSPLHLQRILLNILTNAIKYNKIGGTVEA